MLRMKQEALAMELGDDWNQKKISLLEQKEQIDPAVLQQVADVLKVPVAAIQNFDEEAAVSYINTFNDSSSNQTIGTNQNCNMTFNPMDKWVEALEEIKRLNAELIKVKDEQIRFLERVLGEKG